MRRLALTAIVLSVTLGFVVGRAQSRATPKGHLVIVGGGTIGPEILRTALGLSGGASAVVAIFPQASELAETGDNAVDTWKKAGAKTAAWLDTKKPAEAIAALMDASLIWFPGGDQVRLVEAFAGTGIPEAIQRRYSEGATVGGTSAGAAVMSKVMITGDADLQSITAGKTKTIDGLGFWPQVIVDQHFLKRQRAARLISLVLDRPDLVGVGIDESTAVVVSGSRFDVVGESSVVVFDARGAAVSKTADGQLSAGTKLTMHVLRAGMGLDLRKK
jgi:cyanophycinase